MSQEVVTDVIINYESQNLDQTVGGIKQTSVALDGLVIASSSTEKSTAALANRFSSLERQLGTTGGNAAQFAKVQKTVNDAVGQNSDLQARGNDVLEAARLKYLATGEAASAAGKAHEGFSTQAQALFHAIRGGVEQIAVGIPITQALTSEMNHLTYAATGEGGLGGAFAQLGGFVKNLISPTTAIIGGTVALTAAALALANAYDKVQVSSQRALIGAGAKTGTTVGDLNSFTSQNSGISGTGLSEKEARALGEGLTNTGEIVISQLRGMSNAVVGFANQTGKSVTDVSKEFEKLATDPVKALDEFSKVFGNVFDAPTRKLVEDFTVAGDKTRAFQVEIDAISEKSKKAAENMGFLASAGRAVLTFLGKETANPGGIEEQLSAVEAKIAQQGNGAARSTGSQQALSNQRGDLLNQISAASVQAITEETNKLATAEGRAQEQVAAIAKSWGDVSVAVALSLNALQQQVTIAQAINGQQQMAAQFAVDRSNAELAGKTSVEAEALAYGKLAISQASATTAVKKQVESLEDQNKMIKAAQNGTEAKTAAEIAYNNAIKSGASEESASALRSQMISNDILKNVQATADWRAAMIGVGSAVQVVGANLSSVLALQNQIDSSTASYNAQQVAAHQGSGTGDFVPITMPVNGGSFTTDPNFHISYRGGGGGQRLQPAGFAEALFAQLFPDIPAANLANTTLATDGATVDSTIAAIQKAASASNTGSHITGATSALQNLYGIKNSGADNATQIGNDQQFISWLQSQPQTVENLQAISSLTKEIQSLSTATDNNTGATAANTDALSPYYTQDPRTSHIGFRSQGMASGGEFTVPGGYSANDNMLGTIPLASGEIVSVRRPGDSSSGSQTFHIVNNISIGAGANVDQFKRTVFQATQNTVRQIRAAS